MIWTLQPILSAPEITLTKWAAYDVPLIGEARPWTRHFVGYSKELGEGQCTTPVVVFDPVRGLGRTKTGRVYRLEGAPGNSMPGKLVWTRWKSLNKVTTENDATDEVIDLLVTWPVATTQEAA